MSQQELVTKVVDVLNRLQIPYMFTGSVVSSLQGSPRSTHDIDIIVQIFLRNVEDIVNSFPPSEYYVQRESVEAAIKEKRMFNLIDLRGGDKIDFWLLTDSAFDESRFARKLAEELFGKKIFVSSPEDTILAKLYWAKLSGGSEKQFADALMVYEIQREKLELNYIRQWAGRLEIKHLWDKVLNSAQR